jgi:hypothetical protein
VRRKRFVDPEDAGTRRLLIGEVSIEEQGVRRIWKLAGDLENVKPVEVGSFLLTHGFST